LHPHTLTAISNLVHLFRQMGCTHEAEPLLREESEISARTLGPRHPDTLRATESLGSLLTHLGRLPEALAIISRLHGQSHMWTLSLLTKLTSQLYREGKYAEAEPYARQLVRASRLSYGPEHPIAQRAQRMLALVQQDQPSSIACGTASL